MKREETLSDKSGKPRVQAEPATSDLVADGWLRWRSLTSARIGLERAGASLATKPLLDLRLAHARARDAVHDALDVVSVSAVAAAHFDRVLAMNSAANDRQTYLMRPDRGRALSPAASLFLARCAGNFDLAFMVADGLSARAVTNHAVPVLAAVLPSLRAESWRIAPLVLVHHGRVAIGDAVAAQLGAAAVAVLIGERPGLSSPDSMSADLTWRPTSVTTNAEHNCISNIRPEGIDYAAAAIKLAILLHEMRAHAGSGVRLKDESARTIHAIEGSRDD